MRQLTHIFLALVIFTSCSNDKALTADNSENQIDSLKQTFIPILNGVWVLTDYIKAIEQTKSPLNAADKLQGVVTMIIGTEIGNDSIEVGASWNNHEGYNFTTYFIAGRNKNSLKTNIPDYDDKSNFYELGYETINNQTFLFLYHYNKANQLIDKNQFTKVADKQQDNDAAWGLQYVVNEKLFSGHYQLLDSVNPSLSVKFNNDGSLTGFKDFETFSISTDFAASGPDDETVDAICFKPSKEGKPCFEFEIRLDTIILKQEQFQYKLLRQ